VTAEASTLKTASNLHLSTFRVATEYATPPKSLLTRRSTIIDVVIGEPGMYEENQKPLPPGDVTVLFADQLAKMQAVTLLVSAQITPEKVLQGADRRNQQHFAAICRRLLLPGSGIQGIGNLAELAQLARAGRSSLICLNHRSNLDVPTLCTLLEDHGQIDLFHQIIWIAGRKLEEDSALTRTLFHCFNRVILTPHTWFDMEHTEDKLQEARRVNLAAERCIARLRHEGWIFGLFPSGTRIRPGNESTARAIDETDSYLKMFEHFILCHIDGCTLPVSKDQNLTHETPQLDRVVYTFGPVQSTDQWRAAAAKRTPQADQKTASALAIMEDIATLKGLRESNDSV